MPKSTVVIKKERPCPYCGFIGKHCTNPIYCINNRTKKVILR